MNIPNQPNYQYRYKFIAICNAEQSFELDHDNKTISYGLIEQINENYEFQVYDLTNQAVAFVTDYILDDEQMYQDIHEAIMEYEKRQAHD